MSHRSLLLLAPCCAEELAGDAGEVDLVAWPRDIDRSKRASALDTVIRHREVARPYVRVLARGARINRWPRGRSAPKEFKTSRVMVLGVSEHLIGW